MKKQVNPMITIVQVIALIVVVGIIAFKMFGNDTNPNKHEGDGKFLPKHFQNSAKPGAP